MAGEGTDARAEEIKLMARDLAEDAFAALSEVISDRDAKAAARVRAAEIVLNRGFGAPERKVEQKVDVTIYDERRAHLAALQQLASAQGPLALSKPDPGVIDAEFSEAPPKARNRDDGKDN